MLISIDHVETAYAGWGQYLIATVRLADGAIVRREIEHHGAAACVLPYDPARKTAILVRQFRAPVFYIAGAAETLEAIAGIIETESPVECARREALEEAGVRLQTLEPVGAANLDTRIFGLIFNDLVSNAFFHGIGEIRIDLRKRGRFAVLFLVNKIRRRPNSAPSLEAGTGMGLKTIETLVAAHRGLVARTRKVRDDYIACVRFETVKENRETSFLAGTR